MEKLARLGVWNNLGRTPSAVQTANPKEPGNAAAIANWNERCAQLAKLIRQHGTWHIACRNKQTKALYYWACDQSKRLLRGTMPHEQALQLRAIGFWGLPAASKLQRKTRPKKKRTTRVQLSPLRQQPRDKQQVTTIQCSEPGPAPA